MTHQTITRLVLTHQANRDRVRRIADEAGLDLVHEVPAAHPQPYELVYSTPWEGVSLHYQEDTLIGVPYLLLAGDVDEVVVETVRKIFPVESVETLVLKAYSAASANEKIDIVYRVGAACGPSVHEGALLVFRACFVDPDPSVREAAAYATTYVGWREFVAPLGVLAAEDPAPQVREVAGLALNALRQHFWHDSDDLAGQ